MRSGTRKISQALGTAIRKWKERRSKMNDAAEGSADYGQRDLERNLETTPPSDERVELHCIWAVEFYTPSYADKLLTSLNALGWDQEQFPGRDTPESWVKKSRQNPRGGAWINLGVIRTPEDRRPWPSRDRTAQLPEHVHYATGGLYSVTPSLTCAVICFVFEESYQGRLEEALRTERKTVIRPTGRRSHQILMPEIQKKEEVRSIRQEYAAGALTWFRRNLPGIFSEGLLDNEMPTCELVTLRKQEPFPKQDDEEPIPEYLRILDLDFSTSTWTNPAKLQLKFALDLMRQNSEHHSVFTLRVPEPSDDTVFHPYGSIDSFVDATYQNTIGILATRTLLEGYSRRLNRLRDRITEEISRTSHHKAQRTLQGILSDMAYDIDISAITAELMEHSREPSLLYRDIEPLKPSHSWQGDETLAKDFLTWISDEASRLQHTDRALRDHLTQFGSLLGATENIRTQKGIFRLTVVVGLIALATLAVSMFGSTLMEYFKRLGTN